MENMNRRKKIYVEGDIIITCHCEQGNMWCKSDLSYKKDSDKVIDGDLIVRKKDDVDENADYYVKGGVSVMYPYSPKSLDEIYHVYKKSMDNLRGLVEYDIPECDISYERFKCSYAGIFSVFEFFLFNVFKLLITEENREYAEKYLKFAGKEKKIPISDIFKELDILSYYIQDKLSNTIYHNISNLKGIFENVFEIDINLSPLDRYVLTRHDVIHRDGKTTEGQLNYIDKNTLSHLMDISEGIVLQILKKLKGKTEYA